MGAPSRTSYHFGYNFFFKWQLSPASALYLKGMPRNNIALSNNNIYAINRTDTLSNERKSIDRSCNCSNECNGFWRSSGVDSVESRQFYISNRDSSVQTSVELCEQATVICGWQFHSPNRAWQLVYGSYLELVLYFGIVQWQKRVYCQRREMYMNVRRYMMQATFKHMKTSKLLGYAGLILSIVIASCAIFQFRSIGPTP